MSDTTAQRLRALHEGPDVLVLVNAWDVASARAVEEAGFPAVASSSGAVAESLGWSDGQHTPFEEMLGAVGRMAKALSVPLTADMEAGYGRPPRELGERLAEAGVAGLNFEDTDHDGDGLVAAEQHAERVAGLKEAADLVVNARVDVYLRRAGGLEEAVRRGQLYREAGADCIFVPGPTDEETIAALVQEIPAPINILVRRSLPPIPRLAELGVRRVSFGSWPFHSGLGHFKAVMAEAAGGGSYDALFSTL